MARMSPGEFSGHQQRNTIAPPVTPAGNPGHTPLNNELMRLRYLTGQIEDFTMSPVDGVMEGLLPLDIAIVEAPVPTKYWDS